MKGAGVGVILIAIGIIFLYMVITGKLDCFKGAFRCAFLDDRTPEQPAAQSPTPGSPQSKPKYNNKKFEDFMKLPQNANLPRIGDIGK